MDSPQMVFIKTAANQQGLKLVGDAFIGYKFIPATTDNGKIANWFLSMCLEANLCDQEWLEENKDGDFESEGWNDK